MTAPGGRRERAPAREAVTGGRPAAAAGPAACPARAGVWAPSCGRAGSAGSVRSNGPRIPGRGPQTGRTSRTWRSCLDYPLTHASSGQSLENSAGHRVRAAFGHEGPAMHRRLTARPRDSLPRFPRESRGSAARTELPARRVDHEYPARLPGPHLRACIGPSLTVVAPTCLAGRRRRLLPTRHRRRHLAGHRRRPARIATRTCSAKCSCGATAMRICSAKAGR